MLRSCKEDNNEENGEDFRGKFMKLVDLGIYWRKKENIWTVTSVASD